MQENNQTAEIVSSLNDKLQRLIGEADELSKDMSVLSTQLSKQNKIYMDIKGEIEDIYRDLYKYGARQLDMNMCFRQPTHRGKTDYSQMIQYLSKFQNLYASGYIQNQSQTKFFQMLYITEYGEWRPVTAIFNDLDTIFKDVDGITFEEMVDMINLTHHVQIPTEMKNVIVYPVGVGQGHYTYLAYRKGLQQGYIMSDGSSSSRGIITADGRDFVIRFLNAAAQDIDD